MDSPRRHTEVCSSLLLANPECEPASLDMLAQALRFKISFSRFRRFEPKGEGLQKGNASLPLRLSRRP
uniref:Uncharacterized protein n=1 Tax=mine drainage metagenome TaxID=410659 RepID=E6QWN9_9ZZZZ